MRVLIPYLFLLFFACLSACSKIDITSDEIPPFVTSSQKTTAQQVQFMTELLEDEPTSALYYYRRSLLFLELTDWKKAQQDINKAIQLDKTKPTYFYTKALILEQAKNYPAALQAAQVAESHGLRQVDLYMLLSRLFYQTKQPIQTVEYLQKVKKIYPKKPEVYYYQGLISYDVEDTLNTIRYMNQAISAQPEFIDAYKYLCRLYDKNSRPKAALAVLSRAMQQQELQKNSELNSMRGTILAKLADRDSAMFWYAKAVHYDSTNWEAANMLGRYHIEHRRYEVGVKFLKIALKTKPTLAGANYLIAAVYEYHLRNLTQAKQQYEIAFRLEPYNTAIEESIKKMERRIAYEEYRKSPQYAIDQLKRKQDSLKQPVQPTTPTTLETTGQ